MPNSRDDDYEDYADYNDEGDIEVGGQMSAMPPPPAGYTGQKGGISEFDADGGEDEHDTNSDVDGQTLASPVGSDEGDNEKVTIMPL